MVFAKNCKNKKNILLISVCDNAGKVYVMCFKFKIFYANNQIEKTSLKN